MTGPTAPRSPLSLIDLVQARLEAHKGTIGLGHVYGLLDFSDARRKLQTPSAGVLVLAEDFGQNLEQDVDEGVVQRDTATVAVITMVSAANDLGGATGATEDRLTPLIEASRRLLLGWAPEGPFIGRELVRCDAVVRQINGGTERTPAERWRPLMLRRGRLAGIGDGTGRAWWQDEYVTHRIVYGAPPADPPGDAPTTLCVGVRGDDPVPLEAVG